MPNVWEPGRPTDTELDLLFPMLRRRLPSLNVDRGWLANPQPGAVDQLWTFWIDDRHDSVQLELAISGYLVEGNRPDQRREVQTIEDAADLIVEWLVDSRRHIH